MEGIKPYINFNGNCKEAIDFYKDALGADVIFMQTYGESPMAGMGPDDNVMHCTIRIGDSYLMACDSPQGESNPAGSNISLALSSNDPANAESIFQKMSDGGNVTMPIQETFWAERFGMLTDKFGVSWMFNCDKKDSEHSAANQA